MTVEKYAQHHYKRVGATEWAQALDTREQSTELGNIHKYPDIQVLFLK
jgi:hypothetical protein